MPRFACYIGIDYSGAGTSAERLSGLRVFVALGDAPPREQRDAKGRRWSRASLAQWLEARLREDASPTVIGIDHALSFPITYFLHHQLPLAWDAFLEDFCRHWPADQDGVTVEQLRCDNPRRGEARWRRITDVRARAKSVFHFDIPGSVAKSTHSGLPWLRRLRRALGSALHVWPFDGWLPPRGVHVIAEAYPSLWREQWPRGDRSPDQHDAFAIAAWLQQADQSCQLDAYFMPSLSEADRRTAALEGWILGIR